MSVCPKCKEKILAPIQHEFCEVKHITNYSARASGVPMKVKDKNVLAKVAGAIRASR